MQALSARALDRAFDRESSELVAESESLVVVAQQPARDGLIRACADVAEQRAGKRELRFPGHERNELRHLACGDRALHQPCQHRVAHGLRYGVQRGRQHLAHEERVATGYLMDPASIATGPSRELLDGSERQGVDTEARGRLGAPAVPNAADSAARTSVTGPSTREVWSASQ